MIPKLGCGLLAAVLVVGARAEAAPTARFDDVARREARSRAGAEAVARQTPQPTAAPQPAVPRVSTVPREPWARSAARERLGRAERHAERGDAALALHEYTEALRLDPSFGAAYLGLGRVREKLGDWAEADRIYTTAARLPDAAVAALARRAEVRKALGREDDAFRDLEAAVALEPGRARLLTLANWYVERRAWPAALGAWRRLLSLAVDPGPERDEARLKVQALMVLASGSDPVAAGPERSNDWVRRSMASMARRP